MKLNVLTNSRPALDLGAVLVVGCTDGNIKISDEFAEKLGLVSGDTLAVAKDLDSGRFVAYAGTDEVGNKLAKSGNYLQMSSKNVWVTLGGDSDINRVFSIDEEIEEDGVTYIALAHDKDEPKVARKSSEGVEEEEEMEEEA